MQCLITTLLSDIPLRPVRDFDPNSLPNKIICKFPEGVVYAIAKASDTSDQIRPDKGANLIAIPAQVNLVFPEDSTPIPGLFPDSPLSRLGTASTPRVP